MLRYLKLYSSFVKFSIMKSLQFRVDFFFKIAMDLIFYFINIGTFRVYAAHTTQLGGWTESQLMIFVSGYLMVDGLQMTLFAMSSHQFPMLVQKGGLDYYLLRPVSSLFFVTCQNFSLDSFVNLICAVGLNIWAFSTSDVSYSFVQIATFYGFIALSSVLFMLILMCLLCTCFWTQSADGAFGFFYNFVTFSQRPDGIFKGWVRRLMLSVLPFLVLVSVPSRILFEGLQPIYLLNYFGVLVGFVLLLLGLWRWGLRNYSSASS